MQGIDALFQTRIGALAIHRPVEACDEQHLNYSKPPDRSQEAPASSVQGRK